jgi:hypothetical protein
VLGASNDQWTVRDSCRPRSSCDRRLSFNSRWARKWELSGELSIMNGTNSCAYRMLRGGNYGDPPSMIRSAYRNFGPPPEQRSRITEVLGGVSCREIAPLIGFGGMKPANNSMQWTADLPSIKNGLRSLQCAAYGWTERLWGTEPARIPSNAARRIARDRWTEAHDPPASRARQVRSRRPASADHRAGSDYSSEYAAHRKFSINMRSPLSLTRRK